MHTESTERCNLLTQKHHLCPGKADFKPGPIRVDEFIHLHLESTFLQNQSCAFDDPQTSTMALTLAPFFPGKKTLQRDSVEFFFVKDYHT